MVREEALDLETYNPDDAFEDEAAPQRSDDEAPGTGQQPSV